MMKRLSQAVLFAAVFIVYGLAGTSDYNDAVAYDEFKNEMIKNEVWPK